MSNNVSQGVQAKPARDEETTELLSDKAYRIIEEMIVTLKLPPGSLVTEGGLSKDLGIGRTPVREALQRVAREGLVQLFRSRGFLVSDIDAKDQLRVLEARRSIEMLAARLASDRATNAQRDQFRSLARAFLEVQANDEMRFIRADLAFNGLLMDATFNPYCREMMATTQGLSRRFFFRYKDVLDISLAAQQHARIATAIADGNPTAAADAVDTLITSNEDFARRTLSLP